MSFKVLSIKLNCLLLLKLSNQTSLPNLSIFSYSIIFDRIQFYNYMNLRIKRLLAVYGLKLRNAYLLFFLTKR